jgi:DNA-binding response OmpR family regulator
VSEAALFVADPESTTLGFLMRRLKQDGFKIAEVIDRFDLVLAGNFDHVERWVERAPVILIGSEAAGSLECVDALRRGCDDYVERPFDYQELVERIRAVLRRTRPRDPEVVEAPPIHIEPRTRVARVDGHRLSLAQMEFELLLTLAREPDRVFTKTELLRDVWGYRVTGRTRTVDSHASRLRRKLREAGASVELVNNVWGVGYRLYDAVPTIA